MKKYKFTAKVEDKTFHPKGFYYQGKYIILVGDEEKGHTIRQKLKIEEVEMEIEEIKNN